MPNRFMLAPLTNQQSHPDGTLSEALVAEIEHEIAATVQDSWDYADASPEPPIEALYEDVFVETTSDTTQEG